jgi:hypothetical protein
MPPCWPESRSSPATSTSRRRPTTPTWSASPLRSRTDHANLERLAAALEELRAALRVANESPIPLPADPGLLARTEILNLTTDAGELDITRRPNGTDGYEDLKRAAHYQPLGEGLQIAIASLEDVIRSKTAAGRAKDLAVLPQLRAALKREQDAADA